MRLSLRKKEYTKGNGFSLIEILVAVALFTVVMTVSVGTLLTLIDANRKAQSLSSIINNLNFSMDSISRTLRTADSLYCGSSATVSSMPEGTQDCENGATGVTMINDQGARVGYRFTNSSIERRIIEDGDDSGWVPLTATEVIIDDMLFYVTGTTLGDTVQPSATISMRGSVGEIDSTASSFNIQTTVAQRLLDE